IEAAGSSGRACRCSRCEWLRNSLSTRQRLDGGSHQRTVLTDSCPHTFDADLGWPHSRPMPLKHSISAVIFDMDGVLTDSEPLINAAAIGMFKEKGLQVRPDDFLPFVG